MSVVLPSGYLTILQAADALLPAMCGGAPDFPLVSQLRQKANPSGIGKQEAKLLLKSGRQLMLAD